MADKQQGGREGGGKEQGKSKMLKNQAVEESMIRIG